jgi:hypothetical protein
MRKSLTTAVFIINARKIHGEKYDYSQADYCNFSTKVRITCSKHGLFEQRADHHLRGHGCIRCAGKGKSTTQDFIKKAKVVHGNRYDYSQADYRNANTKITINCPEHGPFKQRPTNHLHLGRGCPKCGGSQKLNTTDFVTKAQQLHRGRYDYSSVAYVNMHSKVQIICPDHGPFEQVPGHHLQGKGCWDCSYELRSQNLRMGAAQFIKLAQKRHGNYYDYCLVKYVNGRTPVTIVCPKHGKFRQLPATHLRPAGCWKCAHEELSERQRRTTESFIMRARAVHGDKYDYSNTDYLSAIKKLTIICPKHGSFDQLPYSHLIGNGCNKCADVVRADKKRKSGEEFIANAHKAHGERYDYSHMMYVNSRIKVIIACPEHGNFEQLPYNHLNGMGCPACAQTGIDLNTPGILYYLRIETPTHTFWKIGVTNRTVEERFMRDMNTITVIKTWSYDRLEEGFKREQQVLREYAALRYQGNEEPLSRGGNTELFTQDVLGLDTVLRDAH